MKILFTLFAFFGLSFASNAQGKFRIQQVNFNAGKTFSSFMYKDTGGNADTNLTYTSGNTYNLNIGLGMGAKHLFRAEVAFSELGANSSFMEEPVKWKLNYLGLNVHYLYDLLKKESYSLSTGALIGYDYLLKGEQSVGNKRYDLKESDALKSWNLTAGALLNGRFKVTESLFIIAEYRFGIGMNQIEKKDEGEKTRNICHKATIGLSFNISKHEKDTITIL
jgi:hypothetical protein